MGLAIKQDNEFWSIVKSNQEDKETVSGSISQTWTDQAIKCYLTQADCASCSIPKANYSFSCQMAKVVPVLLETLGEPEPQRIEKVSPFLYD